MISSVSLLLQPGPTAGSHHQLGSQKRIHGGLCCTQTSQASSPGCCCAMGECWWGVGEVCGKRARHDKRIENDRNRKEQHSIYDKKPNPDQWVKCSSCVHRSAPNSQMLQGVTSSPAQLLRRCFVNLSAVPHCSCAGPMQPLSRSPLPSPLPPCREGRRQAHIIPTAALVCFQRLTAGAQEAFIYSHTETHITPRRLPACRPATPA